MKLQFKYITAAAAMAVFGLTGAAINTANAADYVIDSKGAHASITFRIKHLGFSWLTGRFDKFSGQFSFDEKAPANTKIKVEIDPASVSTNHAERDKHIRSGDFLDVTKFPKASFESTSVEVTGKSAVVHGKFTLHGVTRDIAVNADHVGGGKDPWGGFRQGFTGTTKISLADYGITYNLGPASKEVELTLNIEGIRK